MAKKQELERKFQELQQWYSNGQLEQMQDSMAADRMWIPFMLFSGIMNAMFFMSMMSFMGAALSPAETAFANDYYYDAGGGIDPGMDGSGGGGGGADFGGGGDFSF
jgi:hypothetical protein